LTVDFVDPEATYSWSLLGANPPSSTSSSVQVSWSFPGQKFVQLITNYKECATVQTIIVTVGCTVSDSYTVLEDSVLNATVSNAGQGTTSNLIGNAANGNVTMNPDGSFTYTPDADYFGADRFVYENCVDIITYDTTIYSSVKGLNTQISIGADDAEELPNGTLYDYSSDLEFMEDVNRGVQNAIALRMNGVNVPTGAIVQNAYLQFVADEANSVTTNLTINAEAIGNALPFTNTVNPLSSKPRTAATVAWNNVPSWAIGETHDSPDLTTVVQEIVVRNDWNTGNSMTFILEGSGKRVAESYDNNNTTLAPKLFITYESVDSVVISPQVASECTTFFVDITVQPVNDAPVAMDDITTVQEDSVLNSAVLTNDSDIENNTLTVNATPISLPQSGTLNLNTDGTYTYTPVPDYFGAVYFDYEVCDNGTPVIACDTAQVTIVVVSVNDAPIAVVDSFMTTTNVMLQVNLLTNDSDKENDNLLITTTPTVPPANGMLVIHPNGDIDYMPNAGFYGNDSFTYEVCDDGSPSECSTASVSIVVELDCIDVQVAAWLEGAYEPANLQMHNTLNMLGMLPGQTLVNIGNNTPAGQPYSAAPWNYQGTEGDTWTDANYSTDMVDWVLLSFRTGILKTDEFAQLAGIVHQDGTISIPENCGLQAVQGVDSMYIVLEHRNHIGIMTPTKVPIINGTVSFDFRVNDTYRNSTSYGQKLLPTGEWVMFAGDCDQTDLPSYEIVGPDKAVWSVDNGTFGVYIVTDLDMDGDVKGKDKGLWAENNGVSSRVPK